jgi:hypothetical protein
MRAPSTPTPAAWRLQGATSRRFFARAQKHALGSWRAQPRAAIWTLGLLLLGGCVGQVSDAAELGPKDDHDTIPGADDAPPGSSPGAGGGSTRDPDDAIGKSAACAKQVTPSRAPLRRLTRFEYNNTVRDLLGDSTQPARSFPSEELGNGFGNDADAQSVSGLLAEQYGTVAEAIAQRATETPAALAKLDGCASALTAQGEAACAKTVLGKLGARAYRRPLANDEGEALLALYSGARPKASFAVALATAIEALLQAPDFLYRVEFGVADRAAPGLRRPSGDEMATRLSYLFWGTLPDDTLRAAAKAGELSSDAGVLQHARRMLDDQRSRAVVRFFFDNLLPIASLAQLERDPKVYPAYTSAIGALLREETQSFLEHEIFSGSGTWPGVLSAPYTFVNDALAKFYGMPAVTGATFRKVPLDTNQRLGLLTQGGMMAGTTHSNSTNPVVRGSFVVQKLMCRKIALPTDPGLLEQIKPPDPYSGKTARERYSAHSKDAACASCHRFMDPVGLTLENFDAIGQYRTTENGVTIDSSGSLPGTPGTVSSAVELARALSESEEAQLCFATHWLNYAYGRTFASKDVADECVEQRVQAAFKDAGYDVRELLLALTQTDAFLYLPGS